MRRQCLYFFCSSKPFVLFLIVGYKQILIRKILKLKLNLKKLVQKNPVS
ncbi:hypothetical protein BGAPBR_E0053 (plasmid) [Borreliella garinii PBr]|uniref:Uncharacterized protein n=1 Tax=Borreliella garinii PBr TaxID=498743 RepID=B8F0N3_BORGR|nr:hypothetical protein BGAPBR_E0053 [Borreliella garinii PBr]